MEPLSKIGRRTAIAITGSLIAGGFSASSFAKEVDGAAQGLSIGGRVISVLHSSDPRFGSRVDAAFPGLRQDSRYTAIAPFSFLITNSGGPAVKAMGIKWSVATKSGTYQTTVPLFHNADFRTFSGVKSLISARFNLIGLSGNLLLSPVFRWSSESFSSTPMSGWNYIANSLELNDFMAFELQSARSVSMQVDAVIYDDWNVIGPDSANLAKRLRVRRNAEHDEAVVVLKQIHSNAADQEIFRTLEEHQSIKGAAGKDISFSDKFSYLYWQARTRQARALLDSFTHTSRDAFTNDLVTLKGQPKTITKRLNS